MSPDDLSFWARKVRNAEHPQEVKPWPQLQTALRHLNKDLVEYDKLASIKKLSQKDYKIFIS